MCSSDLTEDAGDLGSIPGLGRSPGEGNGNLLQYSCLGNPMDRGAWRDKGDGVSQNGWTCASHLVVSDSLQPHGLIQSMEFSMPEYWSG